MGFRRLRNETGRRLFGSHKDDEFTLTATLRRRRPARLIIVPIDLRKAMGVRECPVHKWREADPRRGRAVRLTILPAALRRAITKSVEDQGKCWRHLPPARVVE